MHCSPSRHPQGGTHLCTSFCDSGWAGPRGAAAAALSQELSCVAQEELYSLVTFVEVPQGFKGLGTKVVDA